MNRMRRPDRESFIFLILSIVVWIYIWLRAILVPLIYDEIATFFHYIHTHSFLPFQAHPDANNHLLNSALSWICYELLGPSPWALRLPNILSFPVYALFVFLLSRQITQVRLRWIFIISLLFTHHFIEFFALARGYGMSMAFMMAACWFLFKTMRDFRIKDHALALLYLVLAVAANLNILYTLLLAVIIPLMKIISRRSIRTNLLHVKYLLAIFITGCIPVVFYILYLFMLKEQGALYYGSAGVLFTSTIGSLGTLLFTSHRIAFLVYVPILLLAMVAVYVYLNAFKPSPQKWLDHRFIFSFLLIGNLIAAWLAHVIFKINYHEARTALYLYPMLVGSVLFTADAFMKASDKHLYLLLLVPLLLIPVHYIQNINLSHVSIENERIPGRFYQNIVSQRDPNGYPLTVGGYRGREMQWAYLNFREGGKAGVLQSTDYPGNLADFQIADIKANPPWMETYDSLDYDPQTQFCLLKRKDIAERIPIADFGVDPMMQETMEEYISIGSGRADSLTGLSLYAGYRLSLSSPAKPLRAWIVFTVFDANGQALRYERIPLDWLKTVWGGEETNLVNGMYIYQLPDNADTFVTYLWNIDKKPVKINNGSCELYKLKFTGY